MSVYNKNVRLKSIKIYGICLWINRNSLHHFSFYLYSAQTSNVTTWSRLNFKTNVEVVLFKSENLIKTIWWLSVTFIAWGNHLGSLAYRQLVSMSCGMKLCHLVLHPPWSIDLLPAISFGKGVSIFMSFYNFLVLIPYFSVYFYCNIVLDIVHFVI